MMSAATLIGELREMGIRVQLGAAGKVKLVGPRDRITQEIIERVRAQKIQIKAMLAEGMPEVPEGPEVLTPARDAYDKLIATLARVHDAHATAPLHIRPRIAQILAEVEPIIGRLFEAGDYTSLRYALTDLERNVKDALRRRGYDNTI